MCFSCFNSVTGKVFRHQKGYDIRQKVILIGWTWMSFNIKKSILIKIQAHLKLLLGGGEGDLELVELWLLRPLFFSAFLENFTFT